MDAASADPYTERLIEDAPFLVWVTDAAAEVIYANTAWHAFTGCGLTGYTGAAWLDGVHADDRARCHAALRPDGGELELRLRRRDGAYRWLHARVRAHYDSDGEVLGYAVYGVDVTALHDAREAEYNARLRLELAISGANEGIWDRPDYDRDDEYWSPRIYELLGYEDRAFAGGYTALLERVHPDDRDLIVDGLGKAIDRRATYNQEYRLRTRSGDYRWFHSRAVIVRDANGRPTRMTGSLADINARKTAEFALRDEKEKAEVTLASLAEGVITIDDNGVIEYMKGAAERLSGAVPDGWRGHPLDAVLPVVDDDGQPLGLQAVCRGVGQDERRTLEGYLTLRPGKRTVLEITVAPLGGGRGHHTGDIVVLRDVTEARRMARRMAHQATHDPLTNLVNRREFERRLERILRSARDDATRHALCYIDLDQFKIINDSCGHSAGDELLKQIARLLRGAVRKRDTVCRLGGDEFGVLMEHCDLEHAVRSADLIRERTATYRFTWEGRGFAIGTSIGVVAITTDSDDLAGVLRRADAACYAAKEQGRNRVHVYHDDDVEMARMHSEMRWVARINHALEGDAFELHYQAVHAAGTQRSGAPYYEFLLRMREADSLVAPGNFLPAAERYGLATRVDRWVVEHALTLLASNTLPGGSDAVWAINLSGASLGDEHFTAWVVEQFETSGVDGARVCFELTETAAITNHTSAIVFLETLRERGVRFALDDFGSGLSSFAYLKTLPVDFLKIDGVFVRDLASDRIAHGIVKAIVEIGHLIGSTTIAEFVEDEATARELERLGADYLQGYHFARPRPAVADVRDSSRTKSA